MGLRLSEGVSWPGAAGCVRRGRLDDVGSERLEPAMAAGLLVREGWAAAPDAPRHADGERGE